MKSKIIDKRAKLTDETRGLQIKTTRIEYRKTCDNFVEKSRKETIEPFEQYIILSNSADVLRKMGATVTQETINTPYGEMVFRETKLNGPVKIVYEYDVERFKKGNCDEI